MNKQEIVASTGRLQRFWTSRNAKFREWYEQIRMVDTLAQKNMESFVGNDPRASFNLIGSILKQKIPHRLPPELLSADQLAPASELSRVFDTIWRHIRDDYRLRGAQWDDDLVDFLLATGWYSVFVTPTLDGSGVVGEIWNPATVFPMWDTGLSECAHVFTPGENAIRSLTRRNGWRLKSNPSQNTTIYDYWWIQFDNNLPVVHNAILVGDEEAKPDTPHPRYPRLPIFVGAVGGLPDTGELANRKGAGKWKEEKGQSFLATNENVYKTINKWWTFMLQILRDTAQPRTYERSAGNAKLVQPETWNTRGAHYKIGPQDEIGFITPPPIPVELRSTQLDLEAMEQRGGPSWAMFGASQQRMTAYAMSQIASTTHQVSRAYHRGVIDCTTDVDNFIYDMARVNKYKPYGMEIPDNLPVDARLSAEYELRVPGDMVQRATTSRMLNPEFELSDEYVIEHNFPEIRNPAEELSRVQASKARKHPIYQQVALISALREDAALLRKVNDVNAATLYERAADRLEQEIVGVPERQQAVQLRESTPGREQMVRARPEVSPPPTEGESGGGARP